MPLRAGYSKRTIAANISELFTSGHSRESAIYVAYAAARKAWFARFPHGHLPWELRYPKRATRKIDYDRQGRPLPDLVDQAQANPVEIRFRYSSRGRNKWHVYRDGIFVKSFATKTEAEAFIKSISTNPRKQPDLTRAIKLYQGFTGKVPRVLKKIAVPPLPRTGLTIGKMIGIIYSVDATGEKFHHAFKSKARPLLIVSADGRQVFLSGGSYTFTKRGFVDR